MAATMDAEISAHRYGEQGREKDIISENSYDGSVGIPSAQQLMTSDVLFHQS